MSLVFNVPSCHHTNTVISVLTDTLLTAGYFIKTDRFKTTAQADKGKVFIPNNGY